MFATALIAAAVLANALTLARENVPRGTPPLSRPALLSVPVVVQPSRSEDRSVVAGTLREASAIWNAVGISFAWTVANADGPSGTSTDDDDCVLHVRITDEVNATAANRAALGWITFTTPDSPERVIHLSLGSAMRLLETTPRVREAPLVARDLLLGRALGRALAHELGHYLLGPAHTDRGLMRATRRAEDFFAIERRGFELTPEQVLGLTNMAK